MRAFWMFLLIFWIIIIYNTDIIAYLIWWLLVFIGLNLLLFWIFTKKKDSQDSYVKFGDYKIFK